MEELLKVKNMKKKKLKFGDLLSLTLLMCGACIMIFPFVWMILSSLMFVPLNLYIFPRLYLVSERMTILGGLLGIPAATNFWKVGLERALEWLPPTQIAKVV